ncbi:heme o synthase [Pseudomonas sp. MSSRFD41]|uniref:heme o synthase n=1 Tax=Pseudomonas sp. MSSRFD41 TaxID=1310370 RepID=UPI0021ADB768|nr:heme o synthase [Pseudomonas sp. MSSRFD41]
MTMAWQLVKPGIVVGNLIAVLGGYFLASRGQWYQPRLLLATALGTTLVVAGGCVLNNCIDRDIDRRMVRTCHRVMALRACPLGLAAGYGVLLAGLGLVLLQRCSNDLAAALAGLGLLFYVGLYSLWFKRRSLYGTAVGSLAGAMPPVIGYCALSARFDAPALWLLLMFCCWQIPHAHAIALYRHDDLRAAGLPILTMARGRRQIVIGILAFVLSAMALGLSRAMDMAWFLVIGGLGGYWLAVALARPGHGEERRWARRMFGWSIVLVLASSLMMSTAHPGLPIDVGGTPALGGRTPG